MKKTKAGNMRYSTQQIYAKKLGKSFWEGRSLNGVNGGLFQHLIAEIKY